MIKLLFKGTDNRDCELFVGITGKMYYMTEEEKQGEDLGFFHGYKVLTGQGPADVAALWNSGAGFIATETKNVFRYVPGATAPGRAR